MPPSSHTCSAARLRRPPFLILPDPVPFVCIPQRGVERRLLDSLHLSITAATPAPPAAAARPRRRTRNARFPAAAHEVSQRSPRPVRYGRSPEARRREGPPGDFFEYMERLRNYEHSVSRGGAGNDSDDGFDVGSMRLFVRQLGDPDTHCAVFTAPAFLLLSQENVDTDIIKVSYATSITSLPPYMTSQVLCSSLLNV
ncbi:hypothetical protein SORBI_3008G137200 [Sorghum bicolor]|uniref:Uncharacterized protein n=2 Tax=Sorghum bicolor TaxID=4558 RepID=A0A1Z5R7H1_SORBI|nr:hypothetical protein SORBI_3008G137200 [Sorghum bicolor]